MRVRTLGLVLAAGGLLTSLSTAASAECVRISAAGDGLTKDIAVVMSTHGLQNIIDNRGLKGSGSVKTTCEAGAIMTECHSTQLACK